MEIPEDYQQLCKDLAKVLREFNSKHGWFGEKDVDKQKEVYRFSGKITPSGSKMSDIQFSWESGRHGVEEGKISIDTTIRVNVKIDDK